MAKAKYYAREARSMIAFMADTLKRPCTDCGRRTLHRAGATPLCDDCAASLIDRDALRRAVSNRPTCPRAAKGQDCGCHLCCEWP